MEQEVPAAYPLANLLGGVLLHAGVLVVGGLMSQQLAHKLVSDMALVVAEPII
tara:strand:- start:65 stop:223 length:159 start_codon:yes stop_codon:yes gene_type:complete